MTEMLERGEVIALLETLGGEDDEQVLAAARQLDSQVKAAGLSWEALLVSERAAPEADSDDDDEEDADEDDDELADDEEWVEEDNESDDTDEEESDESSDTVESNAESLALIEELLARPGYSDDFRAELNDYKSDIAEGKFEMSDRKYVQALHKRLSKAKRSKE